MEVTTMTHAMQLRAQIFKSFNFEEGLVDAGDHFRYTFLLASCSRLGAGREGEQLHALAIKRGVSGDRFVQNSLVHLYSRCHRCLDFATRVFDRIPQRDVVSWTAFINGNIDAGRPVDALGLFDMMQDDGITPNDATFVSVLRACANAGALGFGRKIHRMVKRKKLNSKTNVVTALIDMYAKCGCIEDARNLFCELSDKDVFAWTAMISGLASHGKSEEALHLFQMMRQLEIRPNVRTITAVLCACRSSGLVAEGYSHYNSMKKYGITPRIEHYGCMVDLLARAGHLQEAEQFIQRMPMKPDAILWRTLMWASKLHKDFDRAERLMNEQQVLETIDSAEASDYVLVGNIYASAGKWKEKATVRELMACRRVVKLHGCSKIEVQGVIHEFKAGDSSHPDAKRIYHKLNEMAERLKAQGHCPELSEVLIDLDGEERASQLRHHSEKLAVAYGLISMNPGERILVTKNLRSCEDCHSAMKLVSRIYGREIIIRDRIKFHHFREGCCSCKDYW